jgi:hypothetical protein
MENWLFQLVEPSLSKPDLLSFEDVLLFLEKPQRMYLLNTLPLSDQACLIQGTIEGQNEEEIVNAMLTGTEPQNTDRYLIVYGRHGLDPSPERKCRKLRSLGLSRLGIYKGGLFEWLLLQEVFGETMFPSSSRCTDLLKYRPDPQGSTKG